MKYTHLWLHTHALHSVYTPACCKVMPRVIDYGTQCMHVLCMHMACLIHFLLHAWPITTIKVQSIWYEYISPFSNTLVLCIDWVLRVCSCNLWKPRRVFLHCSVFCGGLRTLRRPLRTLRSNLHASRSNLRTLRSSLHKVRSMSPHSADRAKRISIESCINCVQLIMFMHPYDSKPTN